MTKKLKSILQNDQFFFSLLVVFVAVTSFGLGRLTIKSPTNDTEPKVTFFNPETNNNTNLDEKLETEALYIGSKTGTKYHLSTCPGVKQIKPENQISFNSIDEAEAAGYKPAANCPELQ